MSGESDAGRQARLIEGLKHPAAYGHPVTAVTLVETHISYVLLTGSYAYKIKKAIALDFLDFRTLESRRHFCEEELRLNARLAPGVYLGVITIGGTADAPRVDGAGDPLEYAVKMREFPQEALFSRMIGGGSLAGRHIDALAARVASFHGSIDVAPSNGRFGIPAGIGRLALENVNGAQPPGVEASEAASLDAIRRWTEREYSARSDGMERRLREGFIRECHGDLHMGNIALVDDVVTVFDGIEFNAEMRWIDVLSEVAFTVMDLQDRSRSDLAFRFLNAYLEATGDYAGMSLFRFYLAYRAVVRAKVAAVRMRQLDGPDSSLRAEYRTYLELTLGYTRPAPAAVIITNGFSGSGKTTCSQALVESLGAIRLRTDVERRRFQGLGARSRSRSSIEEGPYAESETDRLYRALQATATDLVRAGYVTVVDGAFLKHWQRSLFRDLAQELRVPLVIVAVSAPEPTMRARVLERSRRDDDASEADVSVLEHQLSTSEPLGSHEKPFAVSWETGREGNPEALVAEVNARIYR